jgi:hypothetical protein
VQEKGQKRPNAGHIEVIPGEFFVLDDVFTLLANVFDILVSLFVAGAEAPVN